MASKREVKENINIAFGHFPFMLKRACVDIIHFLELFHKYDLVNRHTETGFAEQAKWESLVDTYLEKTHSYVDKQRKVFANTTEFLNLDLNKERDEIILPLSREHLVLKELRNVNHHQELTITRFVAVSGKNNMAEPAPGIKWFACSFNDELRKFTDPLNNSKSGLRNLFAAHCDDFAVKSELIQSLLLSKLEP